MLRRLPLALVSQNRLEAEIAAYVSWHDEHQPHRALGGRTPREVREGGVAARDRPRLEVRQRHPLARGDPARIARRVRGDVAVEMACAEGRAHLPIVTLRHIA